jgi:hypothetical protein
MHRGLRFVLLFALAHTVACFFSSVLWMQAGMPGFDSAPRGVLAKTLALLPTVLLWPLTNITDRLQVDWLRGFDTLLLPANGLLWGAIAWRIVRAFKSRRHDGATGNAS